MQEGILQKYEYSSMLAVTSPIKIGSTLKGKNLLLQEQILFFKG